MTQVRKVSNPPNDNFILVFRLGILVLDLVSLMDTLLVCQCKVSLQWHVSELRAVYLSHTFAKMHAFVI